MVEITIHILISFYHILSYRIEYCRMHFTSQQEYLLVLVLCVILTNKIQILKCMHAFTRKQQSTKKNHYPNLNPKFAYKGRTGGVREGERINLLLGSLHPCFTIWVWLQYHILALTLVSGPSYIVSFQLHITNKLVLS